MIRHSSGREQRIDFAGPKRDLLVEVALSGHCSAVESMAYLPGLITLTDQREF